MKRLVLLVILCMFPVARGGKVDFDSQGFFRVDGKPFFPIGCWVYGMDPSIMADLHDHHFNTVVRWGFKPEDMKLFERHGMVAIPPATDEFMKLKDSPALLAWYLEDEPEEHNVAPAELKKKYDAVKAKDADHPIGVTHDTLHGPGLYKNCCDFTMTDVYPVTADRKWPLNAVGMYTDKPREIHGRKWTNLTFVQTFGGPASDGGLWAQPLPHEVRFMAFNALVHRANGILYFSYWPQAAATWESVGQVNRELERLVPWLVSKGEEMPATASEIATSAGPATKPATASIELRARKIGQSWLVIATNVMPRTIDATLRVPDIGDATLDLPFESGRSMTAKAGAWQERFDAYEAKTYLLGSEPRLE